MTTCVACVLVSLSSLGSFAPRFGLKTSFCVAENCVCIPRGTHPVVRRFLALHKNLFPLKALKDLDHNRVRYAVLILAVLPPRCCTAYDVSSFGDHRLEAAWHQNSKACIFLLCLIPAAVYLGMSRWYREINPSSLNIGPIGAPYSVMIDHHTPWTMMMNDIGTKSTANSIESVCPLQ